MPSQVVIGFGTNITGLFDDACVISLNWGYNPESQRLYCLGSMTASFVVQHPTETISLTVYSDATTGVTTPIDVRPSEDCGDLNDYDIGITFGNCAGQQPDDIIRNPNMPWYLTGYSFSKDDPNMPGQETWSFQRWVNLDNTSSPSYPRTVGGTDYLEATQPTVVLRNVSEGQTTAQLVTGVDLDNDTVINSRSGSVSAGQIGNADEMEVGTVEFVGDPQYSAGDTENGSASISLNPMWL